jgi:hypothetical protein
MISTASPECYTYFNFNEPADTLNDKLAGIAPGPDAVISQTHTPSYNAPSGLQDTV